MKKITQTSQISRAKKIACTVSAAALMLGVSSAATIGLHFQENYCGSPAYSGFPVTMTAFGVESNGWENLLEMDNGYGGCSGPLGYSLGPELIDSTTSTNGLNPLPNGALSVTWSGPTANYDPFAGYAGTPPYYYGVGGGTQAADDRTNPVSGEQQVYATFIRDGVNYGPGESAGDNDQPPYLVDITGLKSLFTNSPFVVELMASSDSMETLTNALVIDVTNNLTNSVSYPSTPPVQDAQSTPWLRGNGGGLSTGSAPLNTDHIQITSVQPAHGGVQTDGTGFNQAGTISGFIITDKPVISMSPQSIPFAAPGDSVNLSAYAIGVPPLSLQWRKGGTLIPGATNLSYAFSNITAASGGSFDLVVSNAYGVATSKVATVTIDQIAQVGTSNLVFDSSTNGTQHDGVNLGATWEASDSDGTTTRAGVMSFGVGSTNGISVADSSALDGQTGTYTFWMRAAVNNNVGTGATILCRPDPGTGNDFIIYEGSGAPGNLYVQGPKSAFTIGSTAVVGDNKWHFVAVSFDQSASGGATLYIDGAVDSTNANAIAWTWTTGQPLQIGYTTDLTYQNYTGLLDDVRYYNDLLSSAQISTLFNGGADDNDLQMELDFANPPGDGYILNWNEGTAVLQSAPNLQGPWLDVQAATSPYTIVPSQAQQFFRYRHTAQTLVSNPFLM
jgi:hypothetical protein